MTQMTQINSCADEYKPAGRSDLCHLCHLRSNITDKLAFINEPTFIN